jgi:hypothetical protein
MPLNEEFKGLGCRTGNYMLFHFFHLRHRLPGSAARIIAQNFASCRLACSFRIALFLVLMTITSFLSSIGLGENGLRAYNHHMRFPDTMTTFFTWGHPLT